MNTKLLEEAPGVVSLMRWMVLMGGIVGTITTVAGLIGWFMGLEGAPTIVGSGLGVFAVGELAKSIQKHAENKGR